MHSNTWNHFKFEQSKIELFEIELFDHLTVCKQINDISDT